MYNIKDSHVEHRDRDGFLNPSWFWEHSDIPNNSLHKLISNFRIGYEIENNIYNGWVPIDYWVWSSSITLFFGIWTVAKEDSFLEKIHTWYLAVNNIQDDYCPTMMSTNEKLDSNYGLVQIDRGLSPIKWMFLNDIEKSKYLLNKIVDRITLEDLVYNNIGLDAFSETNLLSYVLKKIIPEQVDFKLPLDIGYYVDEHFIYTRGS